MFSYPLITIIAILVGGVMYFFAKDTGRNVGKWFLGGLLATGAALLAVKKIQEKKDQKK